MPVFKLFGKFFFGENTLITVCLIVIALLVVPKYNQIMEKLGFETRTTLTTKLAQSEDQTKKAAEANKSLDEVVQKLIESNKDATIANTSIINKHDNSDKAKEKIIRDKTIKLANVKPKPGKVKIAEQSPQDKPNIKVEEIDNSDSIAEEEIENMDSESRLVYESEKSDIQISSIWETYCSFNSDDGCNKGTT